MRSLVAPAALTALTVLTALTACAQPVPPGGTRPTTAVTVAPASPSASPSPAGEEEIACPEGGVKITADRGDAAAGYREMSLHLTVCGDKPVTVNGRPEIVVLDKDHDTQDIAVIPSVHYPGPARPMTLTPGKSTAAVMSWRNTYDDISKPPVSGAYLSVAVTAGGPRQLVKPPVPLDLGSTGRLEVSVWF
jgi:hypothetical protein